LERVPRFNFAYGADSGYPAQFEQEIRPGKKELKKALWYIEESDPQDDFF
jgi:hypothetical protein